MKESEFIPGVEFKNIHDPEYTLAYDTNGDWLLGRKDKNDNGWEVVGVIKDITRYGFSLFRAGAGILFEAKLKFKDLETIPEGMDYNLSKKSDGCSFSRLEES